MGEPRIFTRLPRQALMNGAGTAVFGDRIETGRNVEQSQLDSFPGRLSSLTQTDCRVTTRFEWVAPTVGLTRSVPFRPKPTDFPLPCHPPSECWPPCPSRWPEPHCC